MSLYGANRVHRIRFNGVMATPAPAWNIAQLTEPMSRERARAILRANPGARLADAASAWMLLGLVPVGIVMVLVFGTALRMSSVGGHASVGTPLFGAMAVVVVIFMAFTIFGAVRSSLGRSTRLARLLGFAAENGFRFATRERNPDYPGVIFRIGRDRQATDHIVRTTPRFLDIGNFRYTTGSGKNRTVSTRGFLALHLDRRVPHMLLDARANNSFLGSNLPVAFSPDQVLSLEGDFDRHFTLYCPRAYERDALYVFTPDLMALLIDEAGAFDVEVIDDWMFVYSQARFPMGDPATMLRLLRIVDTVGATTVERTDYYADERIGNRAIDIVAPQGARLRTGIPWTGVVIGAVAITLWIIVTVMR